MSAPAQNSQSSKDLLFSYGFAALTVLTMIGLPLVRVAQYLGSPNLWLDESGQFWFSKGLHHFVAPLTPEGGFDKILEYGSQNSDPGAFTVLLREWMHIFGTSPASLRSLPFLFLVLTCTVIVAAALRCGVHPVFAALAGAIPLWFPMLLFYATEIRAYSMDALAVAFLFFLPCWVDDVPLWKIAAIGCLSALLVLSRYSAFLSGAAACLTMLFPIRPFGAALRRALIFGVPVVAAVVLGYVLFALPLTRGTNRPPPLYEDFLLSDKDIYTQLEMVRENFLSLPALPLTGFLIGAPLFCFFGPRKLARLRSIAGRMALFCALSEVFAAAVSWNGSAPWLMHTRWAIGFHSLSACCLAMGVIILGVWIGAGAAGRTRTIRLSAAAGVLILAWIVPLKASLAFERSPEETIATHMESLAKAPKPKELRFYVQNFASPTVRYLCEFGPLKGVFSYPERFHFETFEEAGKSAKISADEYDVVVVTQPVSLDPYRARVTGGKADSTVPPQPSCILLVSRQGVAP